MCTLPLVAKRDLEKAKLLVKIAAEGPIFWGELLELENRLSYLEIFETDD